MQAEPVFHASNGASVRRPVLQGRQPVAAIWFPGGLFGITERKLRILDSWRVGARLYAFADGDLLRYASSEEMDTEGMKGWPLRNDDGVLCSAVLEPVETAHLPLADVRLVVGGNIVSLKFSEGKVVDPGEWLHVGDYALIDTYDCRATLPPPEMEVPQGMPDVREVLGPAVPSSSPEREGFLRAMQARGAAGDKGSSSGMAGGGRGGLVSSVLTGLLFGGLAAVLGALGIGGRGGNAQQGSGALKQHAWGDEVAPRQTQRPSQRWRSWLAKLAMTTRLSGLLGRQHAAYLQRMIEMFESGKLDEALRHAIPLGGDTDSLGQAFGTPQARSDLSLSQHLRQAPSVNYGESVDDYLRKLYRQSFQKLDREGRIEEAVFILAELLQSRQEALDYLEKHGRFKQAADLALAWDRPSDVIVRLSCLAGDWRRAIAVARRDGSFANAVLMLEKKYPDPARQLRLAWGETLAAQGRWLEAVDAVWSVDEAREMARQWLLAAEASGGFLAARALVKRAALLPDTLDTYAEYLMALRDEPERSEERAALAEALIAIPAKGRTAGLARVIVNAVLEDQAMETGRLDKKALQRLLDLSGDRVLQSDLPNASLPVAKLKPLASLTRCGEWQAPQAGLRAILDAVPLEAGRYLLALGEAGVVVVGKDGESICRFPVPAEHFVIAGSGQVALALVRRSEVWRVTRLDLSLRSVSDLGVIQCDHHARRFDGSNWSVVQGKSLRVLDTTRSLQSVLWQVNDLPGPVHALFSDGNIEQLLIRGADGACEWWRYTLPERRLAGRDDVRLEPEQWPILGRRFEVTRLSLAEPGDGPVVLSYTSHTGARVLPLPVMEWGEVLNLQVYGDWLAIAMRLQDTAAVWFIHMPDGQCKASVTWPLTNGIGLRVEGSRWLAFDQQGRLFALDTDSCASARIAVQ
ncbi:bpX6 domain-containing protein [Viridibacterium curvum]|uniref:MoxR-vWA-beta-propeller ternary system domain-containing protein n=1 Tax=Viridibacterium curvum TaxID=1101404 RepID=A0ABP9QH09_9RHOO